LAQHIEGPLYYEKMGRTGPVIAFIHPNPMDQSCWIFQMAHLSTWFRCMTIDIPGYGKSPKATEGLTTIDIAEACWEAIDEAYPGESAILVGCSTGSNIAPYMYHLRPEKTKALVLSGTGYNPGKEFATQRIKDYQTLGLGFRWEYTFQDFSPYFRTTPLAHYFANLFTERNDFGDVDSICYQFAAMQTKPMKDDFHSGIKAPKIILTGSEDNSHQRAFVLKERIPGCELRVLPGAGHACQIEQPWLFNRFMLEFLEKHKLMPAGPKPMRSLP
jgi:pimeloyl-ACP methyl ester carboxylesterase